MATAPGAADLGATTHGPAPRRPTSLGTRLIRLGFADPTRSERLLSDAALVAVTGPVDTEATLLEAIGHVADPDQCLLALVRISAAARGDADRAALGRLLDAASPERDALLAVLGASAALGDQLASHPEDLRLLLDGTPGIKVDPGAVRADLLTAVGADPEAEVPVAASGGADGVHAMRRAYRRRLLCIAANDLASAEPLTTLPAVAAALADLAAAALEAALALARASLPDHGSGVRLAVIGMGKCGGRELNYVSDVDVIYVVEPAQGSTEQQAVAVGTRLATALAAACSAPAREPALWPVDVGLRPEGKDGPLVRTLSSHRAYYERWAKTWEFQALLKARPVAGDLELGRAYAEMVSPLVWSAVERENFVVDSQVMRRRVEDHVPAAEADRQLKLGAGGLRDVEFTVQLLQLVHGRADTSIRSPTTLTALNSLAAAGYVGRDHAARLAVCYRLLRAMEHRIQLYHLRRTHLMPVAEAEQRRLARSLGMRVDGSDGLAERWRETRRDVRRLHEELFYRPLLPATAQLSADEAQLAPAAARRRLAAIGYRDPAGAMRHIAALTEGVSRRAAIQRQLLPVLLGWFADGADPDEGLLAFRRLSDDLGGTPWYLKLLRDSGLAAQRLASLLSSSAYVAEALGRSPESVAWLADDDELAQRSVEQLEVEVDATLTRATESAAAAVVLRAVRRRELARTAAAEVLGLIPATASMSALSDVSDVVLAGALRIAEYQARTELGLDELPTRMLVVAMGRLGGREMSYASDADVMFVHDPLPGAQESVAQQAAHLTATHLRALLGDVGPEPSFEVDADLRPEGRNGPLVRTMASYQEYYERWSSTWEAQALLRARPVAGDEDLADRFVDLVAPLRYPAGGLPAAAVREIRRIKARVESERLPRGVDPSRHLKLGRGGLADVEWTAQLLQLQHAHAVPALRTTSTVVALTAAAEAGLLSAGDAAVLTEAWTMASRLRNALVLRSGRVSGRGGDLLPHDAAALSGLARMLGFPHGSGAELEQLYLRTGRRARAVVERVFYG